MFGRYYVLGQSVKRVYITILCNTSDPRNLTSALRAEETLSQLDPKLIERLYRIFKADFALMNNRNF